MIQRLADALLAFLFWLDDRRCAWANLTAGEDER